MNVYKISCDRCAKMDELCIRRSPGAGHIETSCKKCNRNKAKCDKTLTKKGKGDSNRRGSMSGPPSKRARRLSGSGRRRKVIKSPALIEVDFDEKMKSASGSSSASSQSGDAPSPPAPPSGEGTSTAVEREIRPIPARRAREVTPVAGPSNTGGRGRQRVQEDESDQGLRMALERGGSLEVYGAGGRDHLGTMLERKHSLSSRKKPTEG